MKERTIHSEVGIRMEEEEEDVGVMGEGLVIQGMEIDLVVLGTNLGVAGLVVIKREAVVGDTIVIREGTVEVKDVVMATKVDMVVQGEVRTISKVDLIKREITIQGIRIMDSRMGMVDSNRKNPHGT